RNAPSAKPDLAAYSQEKQVMSDEYIAMLHGKESLATYEKHYLAFMQKWNLGNTQNLHRVLTNSRQQMVKNFTPDGCAALAGTQGALTPNVCPRTQTPVTAVQFPEEFPNYCGNATISTIVVEDSFSWPGTNSAYDSSTGVTNTVSYNPYVVSQP